jgi:hypothetical protein
VRLAPDPVPPSPAARLLVCTLVSAWAVFCLVRLGQASGLPTDFDVVWQGARFLLAGRDPWALVGPGREFEWVSPLYYPAPALVAVAPLAFLPLELARAAWVALGAALLAWAVTRDGWWRLPIFASAPFYYAVGRAQWSPLIAAAWLLPWLGVVAALKPTTGLALLAGMRTQRAQLVAAAAGVVLVGLTLLLAPWWPAAWRAAVADAPHMSSPIAHWRVGGPLLALALLRWRRPEARWLVALACVPQSPLLYEGIYLLLFPRTYRGVAAFAVASWFPLWLQDRISDWATTTAQLQYAVGDVLVACFYVPALVMVLRRPNEGEVPAWMDQVARRVVAAAAGLGVARGPRREDA